MPLYFLDTSALVKLYVSEEGTNEMLALVQPGQQNELGILSVSAIEFRSALRRRQRSGDVEEAAVAEILNLFESHLKERLITQRLTDSVIDSAAALVDRHFLRAYDAFQLSGCLALASSRGDCIFACSDGALLRAAQEEALTTFDPTAKRTP